MNHERRDRPDEGDDAELRELLRAAGARPQPPTEVTDEVRAAVAAEWRDLVASRRPQRRAAPWLAAASVAVLAVGAWLAMNRPDAPGAVVAIVARLAGPAEVRHEAATSWQSLASGAELRAGDRVRTLGDGRAALRRADGLEIRLDVGTTLAIADDDLARLETGRVYVDAGVAGSRSGELVLETPIGSVRHLGTQYAVALAPAALEVAVREGRVTIDRRGNDAVASAGESVTVRADGRIERAALAPHDAAWYWAESTAPAFAIDGRTLDEFLVWAARETGRQLVYVSREVAQEAEQTVLKGSVDDLSPQQAITAVLATAPTLEARIAGAQLRISPASQDMEAR
jgi:ferric-dicitrate binding protein FerR (iron transport regulator)